MVDVLERAFRINAAGQVRTPAPGSVPPPAHRAPGLGVIQNPLLRSRDGLLYLIAQLMDAIGGGIALVALPWLALDTGGSRTLAGAAYPIGTLPYVPLESRRAISATACRDAGSWSWRPPVRRRPRRCCR